VVGSKSGRIGMVVERDQVTHVDIDRAPEMEDTWLRAVGDYLS